MRIAFFNWRDIRHPSAGGAEVFNHKVLANLVGMGHKATLFTSTYPGSPAREMIDGIEHVRYGGRFLIYPKSVLCYNRHIKGRFDLVVESINGVPFFTRLFAGIPVVVFIHQLTRENWHSGLSWPLSSLGFHTEDAMLRLYKSGPAIAPSESTKKDLISLGFRDVHVIHGAADVAPAEPGKENDPTLLYFGRLTRSKGVGDAVRVFRSVRNMIPSAKLWIAGRGPEEAALRKLVSDLGLGSSTTFWGHVDERTKARLLSRAHLMLLPARREGWGLVVLEANACQTPVIGYRVPGLVDSIVPGTNGFLAEDMGKMASKAIELLKSPEALDGLSASSKGYAEGFDWKKTSFEFASLFEEVLKKNGGLNPK